MYLLSLKVISLLMIGQVLAKPTPFIELGKLAGGVTAAFGKVADSVTGSVEHFKNKMHPRTTTTTTTRVPERKLESPSVPISTVSTTPQPTKVNVQATTQRVTTTPMPTQRSTTFRSVGSNDRIVFEDDPVAFGTAAKQEGIETTTSYLDDRHVFNIPSNCPVGQKLQGNACRKLS